MKESETDEILFSNISYLKQFRLNKMGAEVVISDKFLISKFLKGLTHCAVSYEITRGIKLVVGRVTEGVKGGLREFWGGPGGSKGVCLTPIGHFMPLWKSCRALDLVPNIIK